MLSYQINPCFHMKSGKTHYAWISLKVHTKFYTLCSMSVPLYNISIKGVHCDNQLLFAAGYSQSRYLALILKTGRLWSNSIIFP